MCGQVLRAVRRCGLAAECGAALLLARIGLFFLKLPQLSAAGCRLWRCFPTRRAGLFAASDARVTGDRVRRTSARVPGMLCLPQALATQWLIAKRGGQCTVHVGIAKRDGSFQSHAWASCQGVVVIGGATAPSQYREIMVLGKNTSACGHG
jgi:hypothetical protein